MTWIGRWWRAIVAWFRPDSGGLAHEAPAPRYTEVPPPAAIDISPASRTPAVPKAKWA